MWLLSNIKLIGIAAAVIAVFSAGWYVESRLAESRLEKALAAQQEALHAECKADKEITTGVSHDYQSKITALDAQLAAFKRVRPHRCVMPTSSAAAGRDGPAGPSQSSREDAVDTDTLYDYAGEAEKYRLQLIACQDFINKTWAAKGQ